MPWRRCLKCGGPMSYNSDEWAFACICCGKRRYAGGVLEAQPIPEGAPAASGAPLPAEVAPQRVLAVGRSSRNGA